MGDSGDILSDEAVVPPGSGVPRKSVSMSELMADCSVTVRTRSGSEYYLYLIDPDEGQVLVTGGCFGEDMEKVVVEGSVAFQPLSIREGAIATGHKLMLAYGAGLSVRTSEVVSIEVEVL